MRKSRFFPLLSAFLLTAGGWSQPAQAGDDSAEVVALYKAHAYAKVEALASKLLSRRPGDATVRYYLANSQVMLHQYEQARQQYELCRKDAPGTQVARLAAEAIARINSLGGAASEPPGKPGASRGGKASAKAEAEAEAEAEAQKQSVIDKGAAIVESKRKVLEQDIARVRAEADEALNLTFIRFNRPSEYNTDQRYNREVNRIRVEAEENIQHLRDIFEAEEKRISLTYAQQAERINSRRNVTTVAPSGSSGASLARPVGRRGQNLRTVTKQQGLNDRELANLRNSDFVVLIDESGMLDTLADTRVTKRAWCVENVGAFSRLVASENSRLTVVPCADSFTVIGNCTAAELAGQLSAVQNKGKLDIATPLEAQVSRHLGEKSQRPLVVVVLLGSMPSGGDDLERVVARLSQRVSEPGFVRLVFIALGTDAEVEALVHRLDEGRLAGARFAMADGYKFAEVEKIGLARAVLNAKSDLGARLDGVNKNDIPSR